VPHCHCIKELLNQQFQSIAAQHFLDLGEQTKVSLALNCWSSPNCLSFLAISAYYDSEEWKYCDVLLSSKHMSGPHTGRSIVQVVMKVLLQFGLTKRLFTITADNTFNNSTLCCSFKQILATEQVQWKTDAMKVNHLAHVLHL
jgi:hypothetical protein